MWTGALGVWVKDTVGVIFCIGSEDEYVSKVGLCVWKKASHLKSVWSTEVSMLLAHSVSRTLLAVLSW